MMLELIQTPKTDTMLKVFTFRTKEGLFINDLLTHSQKVIIEIILNRGINGETMDWLNRIHVMAYTRHGKSISIAIGVLIRAATKHEPWAIVGPDDARSHIIMDYLLQFATSDPLLRSLLATDAKILQAERLTQRRSRSHITFLEGGEVRTFSAKNIMGFGCKNVVLDEAGLISNHVESQIFRMLGDDAADNFYMKVGNPWFSIDADTGEEHHFFTSWKDPLFFIMDIDVHYGIKEGRVTEQFHNEVKKKVNYDVLYANTFPDGAMVDKEGYISLFTHALVKSFLVPKKTLKSVGSKKLGADPADGGECESVIATRSMNLARIVYASHEVDNLQFAPIIAQYGKNIEDWFVDKVGVGSGTVHRLEENAEYYRHLTPINAGLPVPDTIEDHEQFLNLRAMAFWNLKIWAENGGKCEHSDGLAKQLMAMRYRNNSTGKIVMISKEKLLKRKVKDLGRADALSMTFMPATNRVAIARDPSEEEAVKPYYPQLGY